MADFVTAGYSKGGIFRTVAIAGKGMTEEKIDGGQSCMSKILRLQKLADEEAVL